MAEQHQGDQGAAPRRLSAHTLDLLNQNVLLDGISRWIHMHVIL